MTEKLISNEYRTSSLSLPWVEAEMNEQSGLGGDPMLLLIRLEDELGRDITIEDLDSLHYILLRR